MALFEIEGLAMKLNLLVCLIVLLGCSETRPQPSPSQKQSASPAPIFPSIPYGLDPMGVLINKSAEGSPGRDGWCKCNSEHGGFQVELPDVYVDITTHMPLSGGQFVVQHTLLAKPSSESRVSVILLEPFPGPTVPFDCIEAQLERAKSNGSASEPSERTVLGKPGRYIIYQSDDYFEQMINVSVDRGELLIILRYPASEEELCRSVLNRIVQSISFEDPRTK